MGEVLIATSMTEQMSELFDKRSECVKREFKEKLPGFMQASTNPQKVCNENESRIRNKRYACKNVDGREELIRSLWNMDINELQVNDS